MLSHFVDVLVVGRLRASRIACAAQSLFRMRCLAVVGILLLSQGAVTAEPDRNSEGWSQDLLARLLTERVAESGAHGSSSPGGDGMLLHSYQLRSLRLGEPGRATNLVSILRRMLPPDSRVTEDRPGNTLHVLSTGTAHQAALELISAMDSETASRPAVEATVLPDEVRKALESLAAARPDSDHLMKIVADSARRTEERLGEVVRQSQEESKESFRRMVYVGGGTVLCLLIVSLGVFATALRRASKNDLRRSAAQAAESLALQPVHNLETMISVSRDQQERTKELQKLMESFSISYQADRQRNTMIMEAVAKKHGELASSLTEMEQLRRTMGDDAGKVFLEVNRHAIDRIVAQASEALQTRASEVGLIAESASKKMEETVDRLEVQNAKALVLAEELERTQREVDGLFEKLKCAQEAAQKAQNEANEQRRIAYEKSAELTKKEAALAGLSLLLQEPEEDILYNLGAAIAGPASGPHDEPPVSGFCPVPPDEPLSGDSNIDPSSMPNGSPVSPLSESPLCSTHPYTFRITPVV